MFKHKGKHRTAAHNLKLASLLSFVAGMVNIVGIITVGHLTTNVTGHFAFWGQEILEKNYFRAFIFFLYVLCFLLGAFVSNLSIEIVSRRRPRFSNFMPVFAEAVILFVIALSDREQLFLHSDLVVCTLLFAMGMQNALVTNISNSIVRTTHLTGLFTDLGIELAQLFFYQGKKRKRLRSIIKLRLVIIVCFFIGIIVGGIGYLQFDMRIMFLAVAILLGGLYYDLITFKIARIVRNLQKN